MDEGWYVGKLKEVPGMFSYVNPQNGKKAPVPRHAEIKNTLCEVIRKQLELK
jgi:hypothetical protein